MWEKVMGESDSTGEGEEQVSWGAERGAGGPSALEEILIARQASSCQ